MIEPPALANLGKISNDDPSVGSEMIMDDRTSSPANLGEINNDNPLVGSEKYHG
jgi:hypothetical protein